MKALRLQTYFKIILRAK